MKGKTMKKLLYQVLGFEKNIQFTDYLLKVTDPEQYRPRKVPAVIVNLLTKFFQARKGYQLLSEGNSNSKQAKLAKSFGFIVFNLSLAHFKTSGFNTCPFATKACSDGCVANNGNAQKYESIPKSRKLKTRFFKLNQAAFITMLKSDIEKARRRAKKLGLKLVIRLNAFSDVAWEHYLDLESYDDIQLYDYTKWYSRLGNVPSNYHLTFSLSEKNLHHAKLASARGFNVAVVFDTPEFPPQWNNKPVVNGDDHDYTFMHPAGHVIGLKAKGKTARNDKSGFVQSTN